MGRAIVLHDGRVINRKIGRALVKLTANGVTPRSHRPMDQIVGRGHGAARVVDKFFLGSSPLSGKLIALLRRKRMDREFFDPFCPVLKLTFGFEGAALRAHRTLVLRTEFRFEISGTCPDKKYNSKGYRQDGNNNQDRPS